MISYCFTFLTIPLTLPPFLFYDEDGMWCANTSWCADSNTHGVGRRNLVRLKTTTSSFVLNDVLSMKDTNHQMAEKYCTVNAASRSSEQSDYVTGYRICW
jgi:hypothetical protein